MKKYLLFLVATSILCSVGASSPVSAIAIEEIGIPTLTIRPQPIDEDLNRLGTIGSPVLVEEEYFEPPAGGRETPSVVIRHYFGTMDEDVGRSGTIGNPVRVEEEYFKLPPDWRMYMLTPKRAFPLYLDLRDIVMPESAVAA